LSRLAERLAERAERLALIEVVENGSTIRRMRHDIEAGIRLLRYYAGLVLEIQGRTVPLGPDRLSYTVREPYGVVASIAPFNHPFMFAAQFVGVALAAGNAIVLKPSEFTSLTALEIARASEGILPPGVLNVLTG